jgi:HD-like signal output (HDOD) protein
LPETVSRLMDELSSADRSIESVAKTISSDISMTAQIMKLANSSYFAIAKTVTTLNQAIQMLGFDTIKALILVSGIFDMYPANPASATIMRRLNERCVSIGLMAKGLAILEGLDKPDADQAACAGMLSHVGTLALVHEDVDRFNQAVALVENDGTDIAAAEHKVFGSSHAEVGAYLLGLWGFSDMVVEAVACHHEPGHFQSGAFNASTAVYVAQIMCRALDAGEAALPELEARLDKGVLEAAGVAGRLPAWREHFTREIRKRS